MTLHDPNERTAVEFYLELEPEWNYNNTYVRKVRAKRITKNRPLLQKATNKAIKVRLTVPSAAFDDVPVVEFAATTADLSGIQVEAAA